MHAHDSDCPTDTKRIVTSSNLESKEPFTELVAVKVNENKLKINETCSFTIVEWFTGEREHVQTFENRIF